MNSDDLPELKCPLDQEILNLTEKVEIDERVVKKLDGGMSDVYPGTFETDTGKVIDVAVKLLRSVDPDPQGIKKRLRANREANAWHKATHPNVLEFLGIVHFGGDKVGFVSPFMNNHDGFKYVKKCTETQKGRIVLGIVKGLQYMHDMGVIHGDLRLKNILFDDDGTPKICDFGLSRIIGRTGYTTVTQNRTWPYLAPEILEKAFQESESSEDDETSNDNNGLLLPTKWITIKTDIYSLSITAAEIFMGAVYQVHRSDRKVYQNVVKRNVRPRKTAIKSEKFFHLLEECWTKEPEKRLPLDKIVERLEVIDKDLRNGAE